MRRGARPAAAGGGVVALDAAAAAAAATGKRDFVLIEPLDDAVRDGRRLVVVAPRGAGRGALASSQVYLASSFARWLREGKVDGAGRPFGELKDEEPTLRKPFTRAQLEAILAFGDEAERFVCVCVCVCVAQVARVDASADSGGQFSQRHL